jgi:hypothetical protein
MTAPTSTCRQQASPASGPRRQMRLDSLTSQLGDRNTASRGLMAQRRIEIVR